MIQSQQSLNATVAKLLAHVECFHNTHPRQHQAQGCIHARGLDLHTALGHILYPSNFVLNAPLVFRQNSLRRKVFDPDYPPSGVGERGRVGGDAFRKGADKAVSVGAFKQTLTEESWLLSRASKPDTTKILD